MLVDPSRPPDRNVENAVDGRPRPVYYAADAVTYFRRLLPGEQGLRNPFRGDGYFNVDLSISKSWRVGIAEHRLRFRWDIFDLTDAAKLDVAGLTNTPDLTGFGR